LLIRYRNRGGEMLSAVFSSSASWFLSQVAGIRLLRPNFKEDSHAYSDIGFLDTDNIGICIAPT
jgi:hypothetical protein